MGTTNAKYVIIKGRGTTTGQRQRGQQEEESYNNKKTQVPSHSVRRGK